MNYTFTVQLLEVHCIRAESDLSSDKFALSGGVLTKEGGVGVTLPLIRIDDGETRDLRDWSYRVESSEPIIGITLRALDLDQNDSWPESKEKAVQAAGLISSGLAAVPGWGTAVSVIISAATPAIVAAIDAFVSWDDDDVLFDHDRTIDFGRFSYDAPETRTRDVREVFRSDDSSYAIHYSVVCSSSGGRLFPDRLGRAGIPPDEEFRSVNRGVFRETQGRVHVAAYPTFLEPGPHGSDVYAPAVCFTRDQVEWRDVPLRELGHVSLDDFGERMRASNSYASRNGFLGGFPTYFHAQQGNDVVCGTVLIPRETADWRDIALTALEGASLDDPVSRFVATHRYAVKHGWLSGFPNMFHAEKDGAIVCGSIFIRFGAGTLRDVFLEFGPR